MPQAACLKPPVPHIVWLCEFDVLRPPLKRGMNPCRRFMYGNGEKDFFAVFVHGLL